MDSTGTAYHSEFTVARRYFKITTWDDFCCLLHLHINRRKRRGLGNRIDIGLYILYCVQTTEVCQPTCRRTVSVRT